MKIIIFVKDFGNANELSKTGMPIKSGAELHAEHQAQQMQADGHQVFLMAKKRKWRERGRERVHGLDLTRLHRPFRGLELLVRLATTHRGADLFYIYGQPWFAVWAILWGKMMGIPVFVGVSSARELFDRTKNWRTYLLSKCDGYVAISKEIYNGLIQRANIEKERICQLPHGVDIRKYSPLPAAEKAALREAQGFSAEERIVLFCARVALNKGIDTLQAAWSSIHQAVPDAKLLVVGGGHYELLEQLRAFGTAHEETVRVLGEQAAVAKFYQMADIYIFPSRYEGLPTSLMEAVSSGLPCVASAIGGCEDLVFPEENGFLVDPESPEEFAQKTISLLLSPEKRRAMGACSRSFAERSLQSEVLTRKMLACFLAMKEKA